MSGAGDGAGAGVGVGSVCDVIARIGYLRCVWWWVQGIHWLQIRICITVRFGSVGLITGRTGPPAATKRTSAFAHAVVVWLRRKVLLGRLTRTAVRTHASTGTLFCM